VAINVLTPKIVFYTSMFALARLRRGSRSWRDYERGKDLLKEFSPDEYERGIIELRNYLCL